MQDNASIKKLHLFLKSGDLAYYIKMRDNVKDFYLKVLGKLKPKISLYVGTSAHADKAHFLHTQNRYHRHNHLHLF